MGPSMILTDDCTSERNALKSTYIAVWRWLWDSKHRIHLDHRRHLYHLFKVILYSNAKESLNTSYETLLTDKTVLNYPNYIRHIKDLFERREEWALYFRLNSLTRGVNTNNFAEASFRIIKDVILGRTKAFSIIQLIDFVTKKLELYYQQRILSVAYNRLRPDMLSKLTTMRSQLTNNDIHKLNDEEYQVNSEKKNGVVYNVNTAIGTCTCYVGCTGKLCKHQWAVINYCNATIENYTVNDIRQRQQLYSIATGHEKSIDFFQPLYTTACSLQIEKETEKQTANDITAPLSQGSNEETQIQEHQCDDLNTRDCRIQLAEVFEDLLTNVNEKQDIFQPAILSFVNSYNSLKTDA
uniref:SWIM-type domain-containing protein n=1 Tax=Strigamia maritima TaxID=126957 RepID=T1JC37_STRMM